MIELLQRSPYKDKLSNAALFLRAVYPPARVEELEVLSGVPEALVCLHDAGFRLVVVTNQADVARGTQRCDVIDAMHARLAATLPLDEFRVCDHDDGWGGVNAVARRFAAASWDDVGGRLGVWQDTVRVIKDVPLTGTGLNTFGESMLEYQTFRPDLHFAQTHNDYLQLAAEGGLLVGIPILAAIFFFIREVRLRFREGADDVTTYWIRVGATTGLVAIALQEFVEFSLQMPGNAVLLTVLAAIAIHRPPPRRPQTAL